MSGRIRRYRSKKKKSPPQTINRAKQTPAAQPEVETLDPQTLTPERVLSLQRTIGNQAVQRLVMEQSGGQATAKRPTPKRELSLPTSLPHVNTPFMQRLAMTETPIDATNLTEIRMLQGGRVGKVYLIKNATGQQIIVKLQGEDTSRTVMGTQILKQAGVPVPETRVAAPGDIGNIAAGLTSLKATNPDYTAVVDGYFADIAGGEYPNVLVMDFVQGEALEHDEIQTRLGRDDEEITEKVRVRAADLVPAMLSFEFQQDLGRMMAADAFAGNADRMHAYQGGVFIEDNALSIYYNPGNILMARGEGGATRAWAIDNDFKPGEMRSFPYGKKASDPSVAVTMRDEFEKEVAAIYDVFVNEPDKTQEEAEQLTRLRAVGEFFTRGAKQRRLQALARRNRERMRLWHEWQANRTTFVTTVVNNAQSTLDVLMMRGQNWKGQIARAGGDAGTIEKFHIRKRYLHMLRGGVPARRAWVDAKDQTAYHTWRLQHDFKLPLPIAQAVVGQGPAMFKMFVAESRRLQRDFNFPPDLAREVVGLGPPVVMAITRAGYMYDGKEAFRRWLLETHLGFPPDRVEEVLAMEDAEFLTTVRRALMARS
jgi:hypothetical protein